MCNATELGRDTDVTAFEELSLDGATMQLLAVMPRWWVCMTS